MDDFKAAIKHLADHYLWQRINAHGVDPDQGLRLRSTPEGLEGYGQSYNYGEPQWDVVVPIFTDGGAHAVNEDGKWVGWDLSFLKETFGQPQQFGE